MASGKTAEEAAQAEADAEAARIAAKREVAYLRAIPDMHLRNAGMITMAEYRARFARIEAKLEAEG